MNATLTAPTPAAGRLDGKWTRFALRRARRLLLSLWVLVTASFLMVHLVPGDPVRAALGPTARPEVVAARRASLGLDAPLLDQYLHYIRGILTGDLGTSIVTQASVAETIGNRLPATVSLAVLAFGLAVIVAVPLGVGMAALTRGGRRRRSELAFAGVTVVLATIPSFLLGVGLVDLFALRLQWFPVSGRSGIDSYVLPAIALAVGPAAVLARMMRVEMLAVLDADFIRTARAKRLPALRIQVVHALPNAATATLTMAGLLLGALVAGTVIVENVFAWPGLGSTIVESILTKDYSMVQGTVLVYGVVVLLINTLVDVVLAVLDPRSTIGDS